MQDEVKRSYGRWDGMKGWCDCAVDAKWAVL